MPIIGIARALEEYPEVRVADYVSVADRIKLPKVVFEVGQAVIGFGADENDRLQKIEEEITGREIVMYPPNERGTSDVKIYYTAPTFERFSYNGGTPQVEPKIVLSSSGRYDLFFDEKAAGQYLEALEDDIRESNRRALENVQDLRALTI